MKKTVVCYWAFNNGIDPINSNSRYPMVPPRSWTCWVYPENDRDFESWMKMNCPTAEYTHRFNSGDPMYTVNITNDGEAALFTLRWL